MTMRIAHLADLHFCEERFAEAHMSIKTVIAAHESDAYDAILIAGGHLARGRSRTPRARSSENSSASSASSRTALRSE